MVADTSILVQDEAFDKLAPFRLVWDGEGNLTYVSSKTARYLYSGKEELRQSTLNLLFPFEVPLSAELMGELTRMTLHIGYIERRDRFLRGELLRVKDHDSWIFYGLPPIGSIPAMEAKGINIRDLPLHLGVTDFLMANEVANVSLKDALRVNKELESKALQLEERGRLLEEKSLALENEVMRHQQVARMLEETLEELRATQAAFVQQERLKALGEMVSGIAHDFNNILVPIMSYSAMLKDEPDLNENERTQFLDWIFTAACDAAELIKRLRRLYKPGLNADEFSYFDLSRVVEDALALSSPRWASSVSSPTKRILILRKYSPRVTVLGVESEVRQALLNLFVNAGDAMPEGGTLEVMTGVNEQEVWVQVTDTGIGMAPEVLAQCQDPFFSTKGARGSGLGLPMVFSTAIRHGGRVSVSSTVGKGTTFHLFLAKSSLNVDKYGEGAFVVEPMNQSESLRQLREAMEEVEWLDNKQIRVLLVDDDAASLSALLRVAERAGLHCTTAEHGEAAMKALNLGNFELIVTDVDMPQMRGDDFVVHARAFSPDLVIFLYTGRPESVNLEGQRAADEILAKPMEATEVIRRGLEWVQLKRQTASSV